VTVLPRTGFSGTLLVVGTALVLMGLALELVRRRTTVS